MCQCLNRNWHFFLVHTAYRYTPHGVYNRQTILLIGKKTPHYNDSIKCSYFYTVLSENSTRIKSQPYSILCLRLIIA